MSSPPTIIRRDVDTISDDYNHMVLEETRTMSAPQAWSAAYD